MKSNISLKRVLNITIAVILVLVVVVAFVRYTQKPDLTKDTNQKPEISFTGSLFDISVDECIRILNEKFDGKKMEPISLEYDVDGWNLDRPTEISKSTKRYDCMEYSCNINENLTACFYKFSKPGDGIAAIVLINEGHPNLKEEENEEGDKYYRIICNEIAPNFAVEKFDTHAMHNVHYELNQLNFFCSFVQNVSEDGTSSDLRKYGVHGVNLPEQYKEWL